MWIAPEKPYLASRFRPAIACTRHLDPGMHRAATAIAQPMRAVVCGWRGDRGGISAETFFRIADAGNNRTVIQALPTATKALKSNQRSPRFSLKTLPRAPIPDLCNNTEGIANSVTHSPTADPRS